MIGSYDVSVGAKRLEKVEPSLIRTILDRAAVLRGEGKDVIPFSAGEPDFNTPSDIKEAAIRAITNNQTKYSSNRGYPPLRNVLKGYIQRETGIDYDPNTEILVTSSAAEALNNSILAFVDEGDEVIVLTPAFVSYKSLIHMCGAKFVGCAAGLQSRLPGGSGCGQGRYYGQDQAAGAQQPQQSHRCGIQL